MVMKIARSNMRDVILRRRAQTGWMDGVKRALNERGMSVEPGRMIIHFISEWRAVVNT